MDNNNLQKERCCEGRNLCNILNFQDFVLEESKKCKNKTKKIKSIVKKREEFMNDMGDDVIDPNNAPERYVKIREQFIKDEYNNI